MISRARSFYNFIFQQKNLPSWIVYLNYGSLAGIFAWPFVVFGSIFMFDNPKNINETYLEVFLVDSYPVLLILITFLSFKLFRLSRVVAAILPTAVLIFHAYFIIEFLLPGIG